MDNGNGTSGRPRKDPQVKIGTPVRALVTSGVASTIKTASKEYGCVTSDLIRLYVFAGLVNDGYMTDELLKDPTWSTLKEKGLV